MTRCCYTNKYSVHQYLLPISPNFRKIFLNDVLIFRHHNQILGYDAFTKGETRGFYHFQHSLFPPIDKYSFFLYHAQLNRILLLGELFSQTLISLTRAEDLGVQRKGPTLVRLYRKRQLVEMRRLIDCRFERFSYWNVN